MLNLHHCPIVSGGTSEGLKQKPWRSWVSPGCDGHLCFGLGDDQGLGAWGYISVLVLLTPPLCACLRGWVKARVVGAAQLSWLCLLPSVDRNACSNDGMAGV